MSRARLATWFLVWALAVPAARADAQVEQRAPGQNVAQVQKPAPGYAGSAACADCHVTQTATFTATPKGKLFMQHPTNAIEKLGCEGCHGPSQQHAESGGSDPGGMIGFSRKSKTPIAERNKVCLQCHEKTSRTAWNGSAHELRSIACSDCHTVMHAASERGSLRKATVLETCAGCHQQRAAQQRRSSHMPIGEGKMECTSCHNPHGSANEKLLTASSINEVCYSCHAEKRGPFLWQHPPVVESCSNCHDPHGSAHEKLLKVPKPRLCQQCHDPTSHPTQPRGLTAADARFIRGRQCVDCHANIHGSNHPSGQRFTR